MAGFSLLWAGLAFASLLLGGSTVQKETVRRGSTAESSSSRRRSSSVGNHSIVGLTEIIALTLVTMGVFVTMYHFGLIHFGPPVVASVERAIQMPLSFLTVFLAGCSMALFAGLVFSTSCLATILVRRGSLGILLAAIVFILYVFLQREMQYLSASLKVPRLQAVSHSRGYAATCSGQILSPAQVGRMTGMFRVS